MRTRLLTWGGTLLVLFGVVVLVGAGISYAQSSNKPASQPPTKPWSAKQLRQAQAIAAQTKTPGTNLNNRIHVHTGKNVPAIGEAPLRMRIPKIGLDSPVVGTTVVNGVWQVADWAVGWLEGTATPGQVGNMALAAHDDIKGEIFKRINELSPGDKIYVSTQKMVFTYVVDGQQTVSPTDNSVLQPTTSKELTMITCTPYWVDSSRLVVTAKLAAAHSKA